MNALVAQMTGRSVREDVPVPVASKRQDPARKRDRTAVQRRTAAAIMGMAEGERDSIIPDDAEEVDSHGSAAGVRLDKEKEREDQQPERPIMPVTGDADDDDAELIPPKAALVAPDVTPHTLEPLDPSDVPAPAKAPGASPAQPTAPGSSQTIDPLSVLLGRSSASRQEIPAEKIVTAEAAQSTVNASLGINGTPGDLLGQGREMPPPQDGDARKIMEAFTKFGPAKKTPW